MGASYKQTGTGATTILPFPYNTSILNVLLQTHPTIKIREILYQYLFQYQLDPRLESTDNREETLNKGKYTKLYYIQLNLTTCLSKTWFNSFWGKTLSKGELDFTGFIQKIATILKDFLRTILDFQGPPTRNAISHIILLYINAHSHFILIGL